MSQVQIILLGILQGATEFLPISSSGHLVIVPHLLNWPASDLVLDTVLHLGTLVAVVIYFRRDLWRMVVAALESLRTRSLDDPDARLAWAVAIGTIPAAVIGFLLEDWFEELFGMPRAAAGFLLATAALLLLSEYFARRQAELQDVSWRDASLIGAAQALAIAPGLSRSGSTIAAGLLLGYRREDSARFSFLLGVPIILGSGIYQLLKVVRGEVAALHPLDLGLGFVVAAATGYLAIWALLAVVKRRGLWPFALYCALLGLLVLTGVLK